MPSTSPSRPQHNKTAITSCSPGGAILFTISFFTSTNLYSWNKALFLSATEVGMAPSLASFNSDLVSVDFFAGFVIVEVQVDDWWDREGPRDPYIRYTDVTVYCWKQSTRNIGSLCNITWEKWNVVSHTSVMKYCMRATIVNEREQDIWRVVNGLWKSVMDESISETWRVSFSKNESNDGY